MSTNPTDPTPPIVLDLSDPARLDAFVNGQPLPARNPKPDWSRSLNDLLRNVAIDSEGFDLADIKKWGEWRALRALYYRYCNGFEDADFDVMSEVAVAIRDGNAAKLGAILLDAWNVYADRALEKRLAAKIEELRERTVDMPGYDEE